MTVKKFNLPDVGEGLTEAEIVSWKVKPGDSVAINDVICEIETAKSLVELPSPYAGTVSELLVAEGITVEVGTPIIGISDGAAEAAGGAPAPAAPAAVEPSAPETPMYGKLSQDTTDAGTSDSGPAGGPLVGSGPKADAVRRRPRRTAPSAAAPSAPAPAPVQAAPAPAAAPAPVRPTPSAAASAQPAPAAAAENGAQAAAGLGGTLGATVSGIVSRVLAKPPVRKIARDLGIDLADVTATGARGEVTREDLVSYQAQRDAELDQADSFWGASRKPQEQRVERIPVKGVRKATAKAMVDSAFTAPHVSIFVDVDASRTMEFVKRLKASRDFEGIKVSPLLILAKAVIWAAARNPSVNASWVEDADGKGGAEIQVKHFMNLGIAAATPRGLMVPNIKDAQDLSLKELALALNELATTARAGKTQPAQMQGGTLTITNIGALGIDTGTPIINPGEVAIVAFGTIKQKPWVLDGEVIPRWITTLGGSFDHRVVDGDLSARFMADVAAILEEPALLLD
ncbi:dihydrolipoamide acetyltransferase family protein [Arthrobacter cupressi]|uniref:Dihydrolipoamide acetyltransferase component of pyruvate dehydrogenase complex n=1 Tax=Arthrobacter cupressi TaxID=1045773 RepID=A0A1G8R7N3_9MICC|nr:dihydrolipoamide acetyltransferase family protein [Arthrobacter cupressi]NYD77819.1 pyruvate dehydrogenase E2 component (dihydrolipoamide acetyltransferase) [Arthrobacter cupressi]SDJ13004.1 pyruvate dehydrogenase E2 component (dihydrolipoamide acetyltransferase) [Arthrobacter cupressi]